MSCCGVAGDGAAGDDDGFMRIYAQAAPVEHGAVAGDHGVEDVDRGGGGAIGLHYHGPASLGAPISAKSARFKLEPLVAVDRAALASRSSVAAGIAMDQG